MNIFHLDFKTSYVYFLIPISPPLELKNNLKIRYKLKNPVKSLSSKCWLIPNSRCSQGIFLFCHFQLKTTKFPRNNFPISLFSGKKSEKSHFSQLSGAISTQKLVKIYNSSVNNPRRIAQFVKHWRWGQNIIGSNPSPDFEFIQFLRYLFGGR